MGVEKKKFWRVSTFSFFVLASSKHSFLYNPWPKQLAAPLKKLMNICLLSMDDISQRRNGEFENIESLLIQFISLTLQILSRYALPCVQWEDVFGKVRWTNWGVIKKSMYGKKYLCIYERDFVHDNKCFFFI